MQEIPLIKETKVKKVVIFLLLISVICSIIYGLYMDYRNSVDFYFYVSLFIVFISCILSFVYIVSFHGKGKLNIILFIIYGIVGLSPFKNNVGGFDNIHFFNGLGFIFTYELEFTFLCIVCFALFVWAIISAVNGLENKVPVILASLLISFIETVPFVFFIEKYISYIQTTYVLVSILGYVGKISLYAALYLFSIKNKIYIRKIIRKNSSPKRALIVIKNQLEFGDISEEEYQTLRSEIISKL